MLITEMNGFFPADYEAAGRINLTRLLASGGRRPVPPIVAIGDARALQADAASEAAFFDRYGFILLNAPSLVDDWDCDQSDPANPIATHYMAEVEALIRTRLLPHRAIEIRQPPRVLRRGPGTDNPAYGAGVHQDYGLTVDDFELSVAAFTTPEIGRQWRARFERPDVAGFMMIDFWRTAGMTGPLEHMPLAVCDPASVDHADVIETALDGIAPSGKTTHHLSLRYNPEQRWYHYPRMTSDEVLVFKQFQVMRDDPRAPLATCFHSAVANPDASADAPPRQSSEHRVSVLLLRE
jgi:hypothetical protein